MYKYQYKDNDYVEEILNEGFTSNRIKRELTLLSLYYKEIGHKPKEIKNLLHEFCKNNLDGYKPVTHFKMINSVMNKCTNKHNKLIHIDHINITKSELTCIEDLNIKHDYKKILFTLLSLDKLKKKYHEIKEEMVNEEYYFKGNINYKTLIESCKVKFKNRDEIHLIIHELSEIGLIEIINRSSIKLSFIYEIPKDDEIVVRVSEFEKIGYYYDLYIGVNKIKCCSSCGKLIESKSNRTMYCNDCRKEHRNNYQKELMRKLRKS